MNKQAKQVAVVAVVALAAGYVAGILTAPKSGKETRGDIREATDKTLKEAEKRLKFAYSELSQLATAASERAQVLTGKAKAELEVLVGKASIAKEKVAQVLTSFHEGEATDTDLKNAVEDAESSIDSLKKFLDK